MPQPEPIRDEPYDASRVVIPDRPPLGWTEEQWDRRVAQAELTLVRVLLRERERLIAEGKLKP